MADGNVIFEDDFSSGIDNWVIERWSEEEATFEWDQEQKKLRVTTVNGTDGVMIWCKQELPDNFIFEYNVTPLSESGFFLVFFCVQGKNGEDILEEKLLNDQSAPTLFKKYTKWDINCYHISYRRNESATCNLRKNSGMELLKQQELDLVLPKGKTVHVELVKKDNHIKLTVDGTVFMEHSDESSELPTVWTGGRIGLRQVYDSDGLYSNVKLVDLG